MQIVMREVKPIVEEVLAHLPSHVEIKGVTL